MSLPRTQPGTSRRHAAAGLTVLLVAGLLGVVTAPAAVAAPVPWCTSPVTVTPCISGVTRNGATVPSDDPVYEVSADAATIGAERILAVGLAADGDNDLGPAALGDVWRVELVTGTLVPRVVTGKGRDVVVARSGGGSLHRVSVTLRPVTISGQCDQGSLPWACPEWAADPDPVENREWQAYAAFTVSDFGQWTDPGQRAAAYGMDFFSNVAATSVPPEIVPDPRGDSQLRVQMANRSFRQDGTTRVLGRVELVIPGSFLRRVYGIPDPDTIRPQSLEVLGAASATSTIAREGSGVRVLLDGVPFSMRTVRVRRGVVVPRRATRVRVATSGPRRAVLRYRKAAARGAKVRGYAVRCRAVTGAHRVQARGPARRARVVVTGLRPGMVYRCQVRARSQAGPGPWSARVRVPARR